MKVVLANGCFDVLHIGHLEHLREARAMGDRLVVALTEDEYVKKGPGRPFNSWADRAELLKELRCVSQVIRSKGSIDAIASVRPNIYVKGIDYADGKRFREPIEEYCKKHGVTIAFTSSPKRSAREIIKKALA